MTFSQGVMDWFKRHFQTGDYQVVPPSQPMVIGRIVPLQGTEAKILTLQRKAAKKRIVGRKPKG